MKRWAYRLRIRKRDGHWEWRIGTAAFPECAMNLNVPTLDHALAEGCSRLRQMNHHGY